MTNIILCGGSGTRLWPISRTLMPKQFVKLFDDKSLFPFKNWVWNILCLIFELALNILKINFLSITIYPLFMDSLKES